MSSAPRAKKSKKINMSTITFNDISIEVCTLLIKGWKYAIVHFPSTGVTNKLVSDFWNQILKPSGVLFAAIDTNITYLKSKITPFQVAQKISEAINGDGIFVSLMKFYKERTWNIFQNPQFMKALLPGETPSEADTDGMVYIVDKSIIDNIDFMKTNTEISDGKCSAFCYGNSGGVVNYGSETTGKVFDGGYGFADHAFMKLFLKDGFEICFGSGAEMFSAIGRSSDKTTKEHVNELQLYGTEEKCTFMDELAKGYINGMFMANNRLFQDLGRLIKKDIPDFKPIKADQERMKNLNLSKDSGDFTKRDKELIIKCKDFNSICDKYISTMVKLQERAICGIYKDNTTIRDMIVKNMKVKYSKKMKDYFQNRWDKCWGYNLIDAQIAAGYNIEGDSPYLTKEKFAGEIRKRIPSNGVFLLCECQGDAYMPYMKDKGIFSYTVMSGDEDEGTTYFSKADLGPLTGGI